MTIVAPERVGEQAVPHVLAAGQFEPDDLAVLFEQANELRVVDTNPFMRRSLAATHVGRQIGTLFYEPSTRTRASFELAALKLGAGVFSTENAQDFSSAAKGETIEDTIQVLDQYNLDAIVLRHHETGGAARAAAVSSVPIINAGDGKGEHPTQSLLDAYTIHEHHGRLDNLKVVLGGDLANGRTVRSLAQVLAKYTGNHISFVSVPELQMGDDIKAILDESGVTYDETDNVNRAVLDADVVYWTRIQKERIDPETVGKLGRFTIDKDTLRFLPEHAIIMHPLPRVDEIATEVDADPRAVYFRQAGNGLYIRMALLNQVIA